MDKILFNFMAADARMPADGALVNQGFANFENDIEFINKSFLKFDR